MSEQPSSRHGIAPLAPDQSTATSQDSVGAHTDSIGSGSRLDDGTIRIRTHNASHTQQRIGAARRASNPIGTSRAVLATPVSTPSSKSRSLHGGQHGDAANDHKDAFTLHVPQPGTSGDDTFRKVQDSGPSGSSVIGGRMGNAARAALRPLLVMPSPSSVRASLVLGWREEGANRGSGPGPTTRSLFLAASSLSLAGGGRSPCAVLADCSPACAAAALSRCQPSCASPEEKVRCPDVEEVTAMGESAPGGERVLFLFQEGVCEGSCSALAVAAA
ncbi:hypothetical protein MTO96_027819 [Rhipicephalus appendiculatus]